MKHLIWILFLALSLTSCSTLSPTAATPPATPKATWADRQAALNHIQNWNLNGKIALQTAKDSGSASVNWSQRQGGYSISMSGPLGASAMKLTGQAGHVTLQTSDGKSYSASSAEQLLAKQWGWNLPVSNMKYWIRGLPVPGMTANTHFDSYERLTSLVQQGWRIDYLSYSNTRGVDLPEKLSITSPSLRVKIVVYQWNVG